MRDINSLNKVILIGRLGGKPEIRVLPQSQRSLARFTLATNERYFNPNTRESRDETQWHRIVVWGKLAEFCEKYLAQGRQILLEGKLRTRSWQDRDGNKRTTTEIEAQNIVLLGKREDAGGAAEAPEPETRDFGGTDDDFPQAEDSGTSDDDIPF
jgi:single-strand DNA-binding protein